MADRVSYQRDGVQSKKSLIRRLRFAALAIALLSVAWWGRDPYWGRAFDSATWKTAASLPYKEIHHVRMPMAHDLETNVLSKGMPIAQVAALLGPPDMRAINGINNDWRYGPEVSQFWQYNLGWSHGGGHWVNIHFDHTGRILYFGAGGE